MRLQSLAADRYRRMAPEALRTWSWVLRKHGARALSGALQRMIEDLRARHRECRLYPLRGAYAGHRCFIMGNGPSLNKMNLDLLRDEYVWGTNRCYLLFSRIPWRPAFYTAVDKRVVPDIAPEIQRLSRTLPGTRFFFPAHFQEQKVLKSGRNIYWYEERPIDETNLPYGMFTPDAAEWVSDVRSVTVAALQIAVFMGFNPVYLIGCDTSYTVPTSVRFEGGNPDKIISTRDDDPNHFDPGYFGAGRKWHEPHVERMLFHYEQARRACNDLGVSVYNATVGGQLEVFPRIEYESVFGRSGRAWGFPMLTPRTDPVGERQEEKKQCLALAGGSLRFPARLHIETTSVCNLDCAYCVLRRRVPQKQIMSPDQFSRLIPYLKLVNHVTLSGLAEPLMNPHIVDFVRLIKKVSPDCVVGLFSNAMLLTEPLAAGLVDAGLDAFDFSLDGIDPEVVERIRRGSSLKAVLENVGRLKQIRDGKGVRRPRLAATMVLHRGNYAQLPSVVDRAHELGVERLDVNGLEPYTEDMIDAVLWRVETTPSDLAAVVEDAVGRAEKNQMTLNLAAGFPGPAACRDADTPVILANGDVTACAVLAYDRDSYFQIAGDGGMRRAEGRNGCKVFGNVFSEEFRDIWFGAEYLQFRREIARGQFPPPCARCMVKHGHICVRAAIPARVALESLKSGLS